MVWISDGIQQFLQLRGDLYGRSLVKQVLLPHKEILRFEKKKKREHSGKKCG